MLSDKLEIRQYQESDKDAVWELHHLALGHTGALLRGDSWDIDLSDIFNNYLENTS